jgi:very-short-patch-repair endonuclease
MKKQKDMTPHICQICKTELPAAGFPSHLTRKHGGLTCNQYAEQYGEFRKKYLQQAAKQKQASVTCKECNTQMVSHKQLIHHINKHHTGWEEYFIKHFFKGKHPTCECGCGEEVQLLRHGRNDRGEVAYARTYLQGHDTKRRQPGYRSNTPEQKEAMRKSAIKRMQEGNNTFHQSGPSKAEQEVVEFLMELGLVVLQSDKELLSGLEVDIVIPECKVAIEYNGSYWHSDLHKHRRYHLQKTEELNRKGYQLMHIWEPDWFQNKDVVKSILRQVTGKTQERIFARKTTLRQITASQANRFLTQNHLQGSVPAAVRLGLFKEQELVAIMTFSKLRRATGLIHKEGHYELLRFCTKRNTTVVGAASKLFKHFIKQFTPVSILSYANRDWSIGTLYKQLGMEEQKPTPPGYFYVKSRIRYSRVQFQKHKLVAQGADQSLTEYEIMLSRGFVRIWDCGNLKFLWKG